MRQGRGGWFAHPALSTLIALVWLALQSTLDWPQPLVALLLGLAIPRLVAGFLGEGTRLRSAATAVRLVLVVLRDVVVANVEVAWIVINPWSKPQPAWLHVPLALEHPSAIGVLAAIITTTPGTVSCVVDETRREIVVHALDCRDPAAMVAQIKARYEAPLKEIIG